MPCSSPNWRASVIVSKVPAIGDAAKWDGVPDKLPLHQRQAPATSPRKGEEAQPHLNRAVARGAG
ncbi:MAG: DUF3470 domain-containing protein [Frateuria sp.]|nr:DUF3470 domain-containing protein [Frateuria sp.]